MKTKEEVESF